MAYDYDLFVIGAGSGGVRASRISSSYGARVAVAESTYLGGTCVNVGCVPKKLFVYGSHFHEDFGDAKAYGWDVSAPEFDWPTLRDNKTTEIDRLNGIYRTMLDAAGVTLYEDRATLLDAHTIKIDGTTVTADYILIATGGWPTVPEFPGNKHVITSNEAFHLPKFPNKVVVVGGGYIAVEFAGIFAGLGADTTQLYRGPLFLRGFDDSVRDFVKEELPKKGVKLRFNTNVEKIELDGEQRILHLSDGSTMTADLVMYATGRHPNSQNIGLEQAGVVVGDAGQVLIMTTIRPTSTISMPSATSRIASNSRRWPLKKACASPTTCLPTGRKRNSTTTRSPPQFFASRTLVLWGLLKPRRSK